MTQYSHLLIAENANFVPKPADVVGYFEALQQIGAVPLEPRIIFTKPTGKVRELEYFMLGKMIKRKVADWKPEEVKDLKKLIKKLNGLSEYRIIYAGKGPTPLPGFAFDKRYLGGYEINEYDLEISLNVVPKPVSMSNYYLPECSSLSSGLSMEEQEALMKKFCKENPHIVDFKKPCGPKCKDAYYNHPLTGKQMIVPGAGRARCWVTWEYGKCLFPKVGKSFNVMNPKIVKQTATTFGVGFLQGCNFEIG